MIEQIIFIATATILMCISMYMLHRSSKDLFEGPNIQACDMGMVNCRLGMTGFLVMNIGMGILLYLIPVEGGETIKILMGKIGAFSIALGIVHYKSSKQIYSLFHKTKS